MLFSVIIIAILNEALKKPMSNYHEPKRHNMIMVVMR